MDFVDTYITRDPLSNVHYDYSTLDRFYEIPVDDVNMDLMSDHDQNLFDSFSPNTWLDDLDHHEEDNPVTCDDVSSRQRPDDAEKLAIIYQPTKQGVGDKKLSSNERTPVALSNSVVVTAPDPESQLIISELEPSYRGRYKSDYFPSKGNARHPRYVADKDGNHYVTVQIPQRFRSMIKSLWIRVALVTTNIKQQGHFYSPYKFQINNDDANIPDMNPIYFRVQEKIDKDNKMKLQLVLIKSKLDHLSSAQPLAPFDDTNTWTGQISNQTILKPKKLIEEFKLDMSHLAFTLCQQISDGSFRYYNETTTLSSLLTESPSKPTGIATKNNSDVQYKCPHCEHCFSLKDIQSKNSKRKVNNSPMTKTKKRRK